MTVQFNPTLMADATRTAITGDQLVYVVDSSNIEARVLAWVARHETLLQQFRDKEDVYINFATKVYQRPLTKKLNPLERHVGKTCLAEGTLVLTNEGWIPIEKVTTDQRVWDGEEWVCHQGVIYNGFKPTLTLCGLSLTPDHQVWSGTTWLEAQSLHDDENTLSRSLAHAAEKLPSPDTYAGKKGDSRHSSSNATAPSQNTRSQQTAFAPLHLPAAMYALKERQAKSATGSIQRPCRTTSTAHGFSTAWQRLSHAARRLLAASTGTTAAGVFASIKSGLTTALCSFGMYKPCPAGTSPSTKWTGGRTTVTTNPATSASFRAATTPRTSDRSATLKTKLHVFDVTCAGPRSRFTVLTSEGPLIVHNCVLGLGFQVGWKKLQSSLATNDQFPMYIEEPDCRHMVNLYRSDNAPIVNYWAEAELAIFDMFMGNERQWGALRIYKNALIMPNGMALQYPHLRHSEPDEQGRIGWEYWNGKFFTNLYGGKLTENIVQALSRIVLFRQMLKIDTLFKQQAPDARVALSVHDEVVAVGPSFGARFLGLTEAKKELWDRTDKADELFNDMVIIMRTPEPWCLDLPLDGEGGFAFEYSK